MNFKQLIPHQIKSAIRQFHKRVKYSGKKRFCPVCSEYSSQFGDFGVEPRPDAQCVWCGALERHRLLWLFLSRKTEFFSGANHRNMLHVAPEQCFEPRFRKVIGQNYLTADLFASAVDVKMDICDIHYPDNTFDIIYCSHVLEHVPDDRKAMREFKRVLKKEGWAVLLVPINVGKTIEDPSITDPKERLRLFGQEDHVRRYGPDYLERLESVGFSVNFIKPLEFISVSEAKQMGITEAAGEIYFCQK